MRFLPSSPLLLCCTLVPTISAGVRYRNLIKALPWFTSVREKLEDPDYAGWFLKFDANRNQTAVPRCAPEDKDKCSTLYHDQVQTPAVPTAALPHPDGVCTDNECDCGAQPCGKLPPFSHLAPLPSGSR